MQTAQFIEALQADLRELAQLGGDELVQAAHRLEGAVKQSATLRLIDALTQVALKVSLEKAAEAEGVSVNTWLVRALQRAISGGSGRAVRSGKRITGYAQS